MVYTIKRGFSRRTYGCGLGSCDMKQRSIAGCCKYVNQYVDSKNVMFAV
jgi:hypothetical protein